MITQGTFILMEVNEFPGWLKTQVVTRNIISVQQHHTWSPSYNHFNISNHFALQQSMRDAHLARGFSDIAQHFTTFPDGKICTGRDLNKIPAGIKGANTGALCIENLGNFDLNKDQMSNQQKDCIITITAALIKRFGINSDANGILYHHWYDLNTGKRTDGSGSTKSCPGTNFFGGNSVQSFNNNFLPVVVNRVQSITINDIFSNANVLYKGSVTADRLNVRCGPSSQYNIVDVLNRTVEVSCYKEKGNWWKIHPAKERWIYSKYVSLIN